ncbi:MAG: hypothetical protein AMXMBFR4_18430 [Candidatus Hydrogenedentota bacterium]
MNSRDRVIRAIERRRPDRAPRDLWRLPGVEIFRKKELDALLERFPLDFEAPPSAYGPSLRASGVPNRIGAYTDEWGCVWSVFEDGVAGEVKWHPLSDWNALSTFTAPWEVLDQADLSKVDAHCRATDRFVRANTSVRPFERMQFLRGTENLYLDLAYMPSELFTLRDRIHEFYLREIELWSRTGVDGIFFMDDWGSQSNLLIDPELWRSFFKPLYRQYCETIHNAGKLVFFHSDGFIEPIIPDLIEIGIDALNSQLFCMNIEELALRYKGKLTFWGEICRQRVLPFGTPSDVRNAVRRVRAAFDDGVGGLIAQCEWGLHDPAENIAAVFEAWLEPAAPTLAGTAEQSASRE